jgi:F-type H+-transporting ATPase subunit b
LNILIPKFAESSGGISSLGLNVKSFVFQLITFLIVLGILWRWVFPKLISTLEERRKVLQARKTEETLHKTEANAEQILNRARAEADAALRDANARAKEIIADGEKSGEEAAARVIKEAEAHLSQERQKLHNELREELADLVVETTEKVIRKRLSSQEDMSLIKESIGELQR